MNTQQSKRFLWIVVLLFLSSLAIALILFALKQNLNLFFTPSQIIGGEAPRNVGIRMGGMVEKGSVIRKEALNISFKVTDFDKSISVEYQGILPDLFREGQGVVALGIVNSSGVFQADEILAKHDENYMPPEVKKTLKVGFDASSEQKGEGNASNAPRGEKNLLNALDAKNSSLGTK